LRAIRSQGSRLLGPGSKISQTSKAKLIALYQTAQRQCENEHSTVEQLLKNIQVFHQFSHLNLKTNFSESSGNSFEAKNVRQADQRLFDGFAGTTCLNFAPLYWKN
jgi:hypothetical protein